MSDVEEALNFVDCSYIAADNSVIFPEANQKLQRTIKTALQERAEREKGCEYCTGDNPPRLPDIVEDGECADIWYNSKDGKFYCNEVALDWTRCPKCGRNLRKSVEK